MTRTIFLVLACLFAAAFASHAQSNYADVSGSILDPQHRAIVGAQIHVLTRGTGATREVVSNEEGLYEIAGLEPGTYTLTIDHPGFKQATQTVNLEVGQQATLDWQLSLGSENQSVTVQAYGELLKTQDASVGEVVDQRSVDSLPLNGRMLIDLVLTVPGAHISHGAATGDMNTLYWRPGQRSAVSIGGSRPNANYFLLDGATNTDPTFSTQNLSPSPDVVQEFEVETGSYAADMGGAGGGQINIVTRSGSSMTDDQGTVRVDHSFANGDTAFIRYSAGSEYGFMPEGLPGFGLYHDNFSQQGVLGWTRVLSPHMVNLATVAVSRLVMVHSTESAGKNDIVDQLGITGTGFGGPNAWGAPYFTVQGYSPFGDNYLATPMHAWDTVIEGRDALNWQIGRHSAKFGAVYQRFIWPMWGFFQNRGYYQYTNGYSTQYALNDGLSGSALADFLLGLPAARQGQVGVPQMQLRQWYADGFAQDAWRLTNETTLTYGVRYEFMSPLVDLDYTNSNLDLSSGAPQVFIGGQNGYPRGLMYPNLAKFAPRLGLAQSFPRLGLVAHIAYGIFYTPVDMNTWCNQRHNVPYVFPETAQSDPYIPSITTLNFPTPVLGTTAVSFTALQLHAPPQYVQQWSVSLEKQLGAETTIEVGYLGAGGFHLQRSHLINNAQPGPGLIQPRRPFPKISFVSNTVFPAAVAATMTSSTFPATTINLLENTSQSWYDAGYVNVRRRATNRLSFLANYTFAKALENAPDFRSPMFEAATPQNNYDLNAEKGPGCDIRHRVAVSAVYNSTAFGANHLVQDLTRDWRGSLEYQVQTGFPMTISVFGDTANAGTVVGENPIRANLTGQRVFPSGTRNATTWFNPGAFAAPPAYTFGNVGRNTVYGPGLQTMDLALDRGFNLAEKTRFEARAEFFNAFNHTNLGTPNRFVNTSSFGSITEVATPGREIQLSARLSF